MVRQTLAATLPCPGGPWIDPPFAPLTLRVCLSSPRHAPQNSEIFTLTYGALVVQLIKDYEDYSAVNVQLDRMYIPLSSIPDPYSPRSLA